MLLQFCELVPPAHAVCQVYKYFFCKFPLTAWLCHLFLTFSTMRAVARNKHHIQYTCSCNELSYTLTSCTILNNLSFAVTRVANGKVIKSPFSASLCLLPFTISDSIFVFTIPHFGPATINVSPCFNLPVSIMNSPTPILR